MIAIANKPVFVTADDKHAVFIHNYRFLSAYQFKSTPGCLAPPY